MSKLLAILLLAANSLVMFDSIAEEIVLKGAGASFPYPLYKYWIDLYSAKTGMRISYESVGSGEGIRRTLAGEVDFGATDAFLANERLASIPGQVFHLPTCAGAVVLAYNLPGEPQLRLTGEVIADIFMRRIRRWSDPAIRALNPKIYLPDMDIVVLHRSDSSGTTFVFTDYLSKVSPKWEAEVGRSKEVRWPTGLGIERNDGVADFITKIQGSIGYIEYGYAQRDRLACAAVRNRSGQYIYPSAETITAAAAVEIPDDTRVMITDTAAANGYPISTFTWLIFFKHKDGELTGSEAKDKELHRFLEWILNDGQRHFGPYHYAPLPSRVIGKARDVIRRIYEEGGR
jgi:phosphate transport system substrate-binding protein